MDSKWSLKRIMTFKHPRLLRRPPTTCEVVVEALADETLGNIVIYEELAPSGGGGLQLRFLSSSKAKGGECVITSRPSGPTREGGDPFWRMKKTRVCVCGKS